MKKRVPHALLGVLLCLLVLLIPATGALCAEAEAADGPKVYRLVTAENGYAAQWEDLSGAPVDAAYPGRGSMHRVKGGLPSSYDSRAQGLVTSVKDQDTAGICWSFAAVSAMETDAIRQGLADVNTVDWSESHLAWFAANSRTTDKTDPTYGDGMKSSFLQIYAEGGNSFMAVAALARGSSMAEETQFPFPGDYHNRKTYDEADRYVSVMHLSESEMIDCFEDENPETLREEIKQAIMEHGSVTAMFFSFAANEYYNTTTIDGVTSTAYYQNLTDDIMRCDHMITIVGWDDNYSTDHFYKKARPEHSGAWLVKNSWGTEAEIVTDGYIYISYDEPTLSDFTTYTALPVDAYNKTYQYDGFTCAFALDFAPEDHAAAANVFTATETGYLDRVGYSTMMGDQTAIVEVYNHLKNPADPESGKLVCSVEVNDRYVGYHTVVLPKKAFLQSGDVFSVVLRAVDDKGIAMPIEANLPLERYYSAKAGQSFLKFEENGSSEWLDATTCGNRNIFAGMIYSLCNVPIKAMTVPASAHTHVWGDVTTTAPTCTDDGLTARYCSGCDAADVQARTPANGHADANGDKVCDTCGASLVPAGACPYCGEVHGGGFDRIVAFFHRILAFFQNLFRR